MTTLKNNQVGL